MDVDVAVLGGGPGGYTAAIRAAQLGAKDACIEKEPEPEGRASRVGRCPRSAGADGVRAAQGARDLRPLGVRVGDAELDFVANEWKAGRQADTGGVASLFKTNGVEWVKGAGRFKDANTIAVEGGEDVCVQAGDRRDRLVPAAPADRRARLDLCVDSTGLLAQESVPRRSSSEAASSAASSRRSSTGSAAR